MNALHSRAKGIYGLLGARYLTGAGVGSLKRGNSLRQLKSQVSRNPVYHPFKILLIHKRGKIFAPCSCFSVELIQPLKRYCVQHIALSPNVHRFGFCRVWIAGKLNVPRLNRNRGGGGKGNNCTQFCIMPSGGRDNDNGAIFYHFRNNKPFEVASQNVASFGVKVRFKWHKKSFQEKEKPQQSGFIQHPSRLANRFDGRPIQPLGNRISTANDGGNGVILPLVLVVCQALWLTTYALTGWQSTPLALDIHPTSRQTALIAFNHATGFSSPEQSGRYAAKSAYEYRSGFVMSAKHQSFAFQWRALVGRLHACWFHFVQSANPANSPPLFTFSSVKVVFKTKVKGNIMASIRKAFSRPIFAHPLRTFSTLEQANDYISRLIVDAGNSYRFNIQQTANGWVVGRVA